MDIKAHKIREDVSEDREEWRADLFGAQHLQVLVYVTLSAASSGIRPTEEYVKEFVARKWGALPNDVDRFAVMAEMTPLRMDTRDVVD